MGYDKNKIEIRAVMMCVDGNDFVMEENGQCAHSLKITAFGKRNAALGCDHDMVKRSNINK